MDFPTCQEYFQKLIANCALPPKMQIKLRYLQSAVLKREGSEFFDKLPEFEQESLSQMNSETQKAIFIDIIDCFASSETRQHFKDVKGKVRKQGSLTDGPSCYLTCSGNSLVICKKREGGEQWREFKLDSLEISPLYQKSKKKYTFMLKHARIQYEIKFDAEGDCARIHGQLQNLIRQFKSPQEQRRYEKDIENEEQEEEKIEDTFFDQQAYFFEEEKGYLKSLKKAVQTYSIENEGKFKLLNNINNGKLQVSSNGSVRLLLFVQKCEIKRYIESFVLMNCWNTLIQSFRIIKSIRTNTYLAYVRLKKMSMWTAQREAYVSMSYFKDCPCYQDEPDPNEQPRNSFKCVGKHYIIINTVDYEEAPSNGLVRMNFNQMVEFSQIEDKKDRILLNFTSNVDLKTYQMLASKVSVNTDLLKDLPAISILYRERVIQNSQINLFDFQRCPCSLKYIPKGIVQGQEKGSQREIVSQANKESIQSMNNMSQLDGCPSYAQIAKIITDAIKNVKNDKFIEMLKKKWHQRYYLRQRFDISPHEDSYIQSNYSIDLDTDFLFQRGTWKLNQNQKYTFVNQQELKIQKGVLKLIIKQITSNILAGKSIMSMSLPVEIFSDKSLLDGVADTLGFLPKYLHDAIQTSDPVQQIKSIAAGFIFVFACHPKIAKPFNPILGQTFQGELAGVPIFIEQISHHPPISSFYMRNDKYEVYGNFQMHVDLGLNSAYSKCCDYYYVNFFETGTKYVVRFPDLEVGGIMFGDRTFQLVGRAFILEKTTNTYLEYSVGKQKKKLYQYPQKLKSYQLAGGIFTITKQFTAKALASQKRKAFDGLKPEDVIKKHCQISGKWYGDFYCDGVEYKSLKNGPFPINVKRPKVLLPSDSIFREDVIYKRWGDNKRSNQEKEIMENLQRRDRKLREKHK